LKLLQSEGEVSIASTGKNAVTGNLETQTYRVRGPVMLFSTTTAIDLDEELLNRCLVLSVDESREQTQAIHAQQRRRRTLDGLRAHAERERLIGLHQNAQRLLRPLAVVNPYAEQLTFLSDKTRMRRDHEKYLALIDAIALLHQVQREVRRETVHGAAIDYVEVSVADIALANELAHAVLGRTLDELPPQTRKLLHLVTHRGRRGQSFVYELLWDGGADETGLRLPGLIDVDALRATTTNESSRGAAGGFAGPTRPQHGGNAGGSRSRESAENPVKTAATDDASASAPTARITNGRVPHRNRTASSLAAAVDA
jgi:hypothetical protein